MFFQALTAAVVSAVAILTTGATANNGGSIVSRLGNQPPIKMADSYVPIRTRTEMAVHDALERVKVDVDKGTKLDPVYNLRATIIKSGSCGENVQYTLDSDDVLTISGSGNMANYSSSSERPWYRCTVGKVVIEDGVTSIGDYAFNGCISLTNVTIPNSVTSIGYCAFSSCSSLTNVEIKGDVTSIGNCAFCDCSSLTNVEIKRNVTSIGNCAFQECSRLSEVHYGGSTSPKCGTNVFSYCHSFTNVTTTTNYEGDKFCDDLVTNGKCGANVSYTVDSDGVLTIFGSGAMTNYSASSHDPWYGSGIKKVVIEDGVTSIGDYAFNGCISLTNVTIPNSVTLIGNRAFFNCGSLTNVTIPNSVTSIGGYAFSRCSSLTNVTIPNSVTSIGNYAFFGCSSLTNVEIKGNVTSIGGYAFSSCSSLSEVHYGGSTSPKCGDAVFFKSGFGKVTTTTNYESCCFCNTKVTSGKCGANVSYTIDSDGTLTIFGSGAMANYDVVSSPAPWYSWYSRVIKKVVIEDGVTSIGDEAFSGFEYLTNVEIKGNVTSIGGYAFYRCSSLSEVHYGGSTSPKCGDSVFYDCSRLTKVTTTTNYEGRGFCGKQVTSGKCGANVNYTIDSDGTLTIFGSGAMTNYSASSYEPGYRSGIKKVVIEDGITSIGDAAFYNCYYLTNVTIPNSVTSIGNYAFSRCSSLSEVHYGGSTSPKCGSDVFLDCSNLASVKTPEDYNDCTFCKKSSTHGKCEDPSSSSDPSSSKGKPSSSDSSSSKGKPPISSATKAAISAIPVALGVIAATMA